LDVNQVMVQILILVNEGVICENNIVVEVSVEAIYQVGLKSSYDYLV
jgi:hypothetical protein